MEFCENFQFFSVNQLWKISSSAGLLANRAENPFYFCWKLRFRGGSHGSICIGLVETAEVKIFESELPDFR